MSSVMEYDPMVSDVHNRIILTFTFHVSNEMYTRKDNSLLVSPLLYNKQLKYLPKALKQEPL